MDQEEKEKDFVAGLWEEEQNEGQEGSMLLDLWDDGEFPEEGEEEFTPEPTEEEIMEEESEEEIVVPQVSSPSVTYSRVPSIEKPKKKKEQPDKSWIANI